MTRTNDTTNPNLAEPLLSQEERSHQSDANDGHAVETDECSSSSCIIRTTASQDGWDNNVITDAFSMKNEIIEMANLGIPLAVSFFCRMGMASTDSSFVGHIHDDMHTPSTYLAAAVLSDMVVGLCITPPLAFNQVLNALVGQAMGSGNPKMAGVWLQQSMFFLTVTMLPCLIGLWHVTFFLELLGFPSDIAQVAGTYAKYNLIWPIPNGLYQCMRFYFQAAGLPRPAMYNNIVFLLVNGLLNWIFVMGGPFRYLHLVGIGMTPWHGLGFIGAAISLSISRTLQSVCYYCYMFQYQQHHKPTWPDAGWSMVHHTRDRTMEFMKQSLPNIGTMLFQSAASQATTVLVGRLGELSIAASSALSTVTIPWAGTLSATCCTVSGVRVGFHLGRGNGAAAKQSAWLVIYFITFCNILLAICFVPLQHYILDVATDDQDVLRMASTLVPAMLVGTYLNLIVGNITSGVFSGQGRPLIATILSFGLELPMSIGGVAVYILYFHGDLLGVYWWGAISGGIEAVIVVWIMMASNWDRCAEEAQQRQETPGSLEEADQQGEAMTTNLIEHMPTDDPESLEGRPDDGSEGYCSDNGTPSFLGSV